MPRHQPVLTCRVCGCTAADCSGCVERTGEPCAWTRRGQPGFHGIDDDLCTACTGESISPDEVLRALAWLERSNASVRFESNGTVTVRGPAPRGSKAALSSRRRASLVEAVQALRGERK